MLFYTGGRQALATLPAVRPTARRPLRAGALLISSWKGHNPCGGRGGPASLFPLGCHAVISQGWEFYVKAGGGLAETSEAFAVAAEMRATRKKRALGHPGLFRST